MVTNILPHSDVLSTCLDDDVDQSYNLEKAHTKLKQAGAILSVLTEWAPDNVCLRSPVESGERMMWTFSLLEDLVEEADNLLPEA